MGEFKTAEKKLMKKLESEKTKNPEYLMHVQKLW